MKRVFIVLAIILMLVSSYTGVMAESEIKNIDIGLSASVEKVKVGETVTLNAAAVKYGSLVEDEWQGAVKTSTVLDTATGEYLSGAVFEAKEPGIFTVYYTIRMYAGSSNVTFIGTATKTIEVTATHEIAGAELRNMSVIPFMNADGSISGYSVAGTIYSLWNDGTAVPQYTLSLFFGPEETSRVINASITADGKDYIFPVTVLIQ